MTDVFRESPYVAVVSDQCLELVCASCFYDYGDGEVHEGQKAPRKCVKCKKVYYCGAACQKKDWKIHKAECEFLSSVDGTPNKDIRMLARLLIRRKRGDHTTVKAFNGRMSDDLMDHYDDMKKDAVYSKVFSLLFNWLASYVSVEYMIDREEVFRYYGKIKMNAFQIHGRLDENNGCGLYLGASALDHSCLPDLTPRFIGPLAVFRSQKVGQTYSAKLTVPYISTSFLPTEERRRKLRAYFFECNCELCSDKEQDAYARSIKCSSCTDGICPVYDDSNAFSCETCHAVSSATRDEVDRLNTTVLKVIEDGQNIDIPYLTGQYNNCAQILSGRNVLLAHIALRLLILHKNRFETKKAAQYARISEETLIGPYTTCTDVTETLRSLTEASMIGDQISNTNTVSANTRRLCDKFFDAIVASHGTEEEAIANDDKRAMRYYECYHYTEMLMSGKYKMAIPEEFKK